MSKNFFEINNVTFAIGGMNKVTDANIHIKNEGEIICILGPSGIGKTTILRTIAGLEKINKGQIILKDKIISSDKTHLEPEKRNIALSFQENSLFPHYTVDKNIHLGLKKNSIKDKSIDSNEIIKILNISNILNKYPHQISAGEAQRASLARSLISQPDLLLLDEPLSNVDQSFKEDIQVALKQILKKSKISTIVVTHDSYEAFYLGDKCALILNGEVKQFDDPYNVYHFPNSVEVVNFLRKKGIGVNVHYIPIHYHPFYQNLNFKKGYLPETEKYYEEALSLPIFPDLKLKDQKYIVNCLKEALK